MDELESQPRSSRRVNLLGVGGEGCLSAGTEEVKEVVDLVDTWGVSEDVAPLRVNLQTS